MDSNIPYLFPTCLVLLSIVYIISIRSKVPFEPPKVRYVIDVSGRRQVDYGDLIDEWVIGNPNYDAQRAFDFMFYEWDAKARQYLAGILFWRRHKTEIYGNMYDFILHNDYRCFEFVFVRDQTRYRQQNYQKYSYVVQNEDYNLILSLSELLSIDESLSAINYETTRRKYSEKNQRKLMTKELRQFIINRDDYTCQICGKYMPDTVGLHVDHIIPIRRGGKTVPSNLQVTCDKCNLRKGSS